MVPQRSPCTSDPRDRGPKQPFAPCGSPEILAQSRWIHLPCAFSSESSNISTRAGPVPPRCVSPAAELSFPLRAPSQLPSRGVAAHNPSYWRFGETEECCVPVTENRFEGDFRHVWFLKAFSHLTAKNFSEAVSPFRVSRMDYLEGCSHPHPWLPMFSCSLLAARFQTLPILLYGVTFLSQGWLCSSAMSGDIFGFHFLVEGVVTRGP